MSAEKDILARVRKAAERRVLFLPHALRQMLRPERMIRRDEVMSVIMGGEVLEDYPDDVRGHSCLMLGFGREGRPVHVVCAPRGDYLAIITAYLPDEVKWSAGRKRRKRK